MIALVHCAVVVLPVLREIVLGVIVDGLVGALEAVEVAVEEVEQAGLLNDVEKLLVAGHIERLLGAFLGDGGLLLDGIGLLGGLYFAVVVDESSSLDPAHILNIITV